MANIECFLVGSPKTVTKGLGILQQEVPADVLINYEISECTVQLVLILQIALHL